MRTWGRRRFDGDKARRVVDLLRRGRNEVAMIPDALKAEAEKLVQSVFGSHGIMPKFRLNLIAAILAFSERHRARGRLEGRLRVWETAATMADNAACGYAGGSDAYEGLRKLADRLSAHASETSTEFAALRKEPVESAVARPKIVCLCGSTRFYEAFQRANYEETMAGRIVLSVGFFMHSAAQAHGETFGCTPEQKVGLDQLHFRKIELAYEVLILNVGGYIGESTRNELAHARSIGKSIRFLEPVAQGKEPVMGDTTGQDLYYIQHKGFCGNSLFWWRTGGHGYTSNLDEAWKVTKEEAEEICRVRRGEDIARPGRG